jgi:uncharacterized protein (DUF1778 family)
MPRTARIELRAEPERRERIDYAAKLARQSMTDFVLEAALLRAEEVITASQATAVPGDFFDAMWAALAEPAVANPNLARAFREARGNSQVKQA